MKLKKFIKKSFNRAVTTYDSAAVLQDEIAKQLVKLSDCFIIPMEDVVDLGCGTGNSTALLLGKTIYAIDIAENLISQVKQKVKQANLIVADFDLPLFAPSSVDCFFSSMALHWSENLAKLWDKLFGELKLEGYLVLSLPLVGTFAELHPDHRNDFFSAEMIKTQLKYSGFKLIDSAEQSYRLKFDTSFLALKSIQAIGSINLKQSTRLVSLTTQKSIKNYFIKIGDTHLTYQIGFFIAKKSGGNQCHFDVG